MEFSEMEFKAAPPVAYSERKSNWAAGSHGM
jgi:hypothetical protein